MSHRSADLKTLSAPTLRKMLREAGWTLAAVAAIEPARNPTLVVRVVRKQIVSRPMWERIAWCLNHPKRQVAA